MPLEATCSSCSQKYIYPALEKHSQTGRCSTCQRDHDISKMSNEIADLSRRINQVLPKLKELQEAKIATQKAADKAYDAWEDIAKVHAALDRKLNIIAHERDLLVGAKELAVKKAGKKPSQTPEQKAKAALKNLSPDVRAAILAQFNQAEED